MIPALRGVLPVAPTVFDDDDSLDLEGRRRVTDSLIGAGSTAICVLANWSEQEAVTLVPDLGAGVQATTSSATVREVLARVVADQHAGLRDRAVAESEGALPLLHHENRQCGLAGAKQLLQVGGTISSARCRAVPRPGTPRREELEVLAPARTPSSCVGPADGTVAPLPVSRPCSPAPPSTR